MQEDKKSLNLNSVKWIINPYDEFAIEEAIQKSEKDGGEVIVCSLGPERCKEALRTALAMNAHKAIHLETSQELDSMTQAQVVCDMLSAELKSADVIFCGKQSADRGSGSFGAALAQGLTLPHVSPANKLSKKENSWEVCRALEGGKLQILQVKSPFVVCVTKGINEPRYPNLPSIMKAKSKPLETRKVSDQEMRLTIEHIKFPKERGEVFMIEGSAEEQAKKLYQVLKEKEQVLS